MNEALSGLIQLQAVDSQLDQDRRARAENAARLEAGRADLEKAESVLAAARRRQSADEARRREMEGELAALEEKKRQNARRQSAVRNGGEYAALAREMEFLIQKISQLEDETLAILNGLDQRAGEIEALTQAAAASRAAYEDLTVAAEAEERRLSARLEELAARRTALAQAAPPAPLKRYEETARAKGGLAVTAAAGGLCLACRLSFPPQFYNELQRNEALSVCPNCGRFIYWRDHPDFQTPAGP